MNKNFYITISIIALSLGLLLVLYQKELIILRLPSYNKNDALNINKKAIKKNITLWYWNNSKWNPEKVDSIWSTNELENIHILVSNWLTLMEEEKVIDKKVILQNVLPAINEAEAYISFDRTIFNEENSTFNKLMVIESLLKTLKENGVKAQKVKLFVQHQPMTDSHLDFSHPWPITGFLE